MDDVDPNPVVEPLSAKDIRVGDLVRYIDEGGRAHTGGCVAIHRGRGIVILQTNGYRRSVPIRCCYTQLGSSG